jgi:hypothetical protein
MANFIESLMKLLSLSKGSNIKVSNTDLLLKEPCSDCGHLLEDHNGGPEGMCTECRCPGWNFQYHPLEIMTQRELSKEEKEYILNVVNQIVHHGMPK